MKAAFGNMPSPDGQRSRLHVVNNADATGGRTRIDDRVTAATGRRSYSPLEGAPGLRRDAQLAYSRAEVADQGFLAESIHYES